MRTQFLKLISTRLSDSLAMNENSIVITLEHGELSRRPYLVAHLSKPMVAVQNQ